MATKPPISLGERIRDDASRRSVETLSASLMGSGVFRRHVTVPLYDPGAGHIISEFDEDSTGDVISSTSYASLTGVSVAVEPPSGTSVVVMVTGGAYFTHTLVSDGWLAIGDGAAQYGQQRVSIAANGYHPITCSYCVELDAAKTFTLQAKRNGTVSFTATRKHLSVVAVPQAPALYTIPIRLGTGEREVLQRFWVVSTGGLQSNRYDYYRIRVGLQDETGSEWFGTFNGYSQSLEPGVPFPLVNRDLAQRVKNGQVVILEIKRYGTPPSLLGTAVEATIDLVGA